MMRNALVMLAAVTACAGTGRGKPLPPHSYPPNLEPAFFEQPAGETGPKMRVHLIDIGQGAATLIEFSCAAV